MPTHTWKDAERRIAVYLGTTRNPLSGGNSKHTRSDSLHERLFIETKHGTAAKLGWEATAALLRDTAEKARVEGKVPVVVLHAKGKGGGVENYPAYLYLRIPKVGKRMVCVPLSAVKEMSEAEVE